MTMMHLFEIYSHVQLNCTQGFTQGVGNGGYTPPPKG